MYYKYPRTYHFPFSPDKSDDDKVFYDFENYFDNRQVVITEKMDGENTTVYKDYCHARSIDSAHRDYHSWLLGFIKSFQYKLKENERVCGEYLYARHSIAYKDLKSYFLVFSIWDGDRCLSWDETLERCRELKLKTVPFLYRGGYHEKDVYDCIGIVERRGGEGIVMRLESDFMYDDFNHSVIKYVRSNHVQTDEHWSQQAIIKNGLKEEK